MFNEDVTTYIYEEENNKETKNQIKNQKKKKL